ncbi:hypothetical protein DLD82_07020 [Methanospirillum stamsii]|uniref:Uncharacterized protein n=2 Tax=Methanospirillum stamsii TaxID=1277351 RepID=A0A2V2N4E3_9EURY|nr:hypothetical protein DLD82_07020 [Methanospirillum stamsii]
MPETDHFLTRPSNIAYPRQPVAGGNGMKKLLPVLFILLLVIACSGEENESVDTITIDDLLKENDFILAEDSGNITALQFRSLIFFNDKQYPEAINASEQCLKVDPTCSLCWHIIGSSWGFLNQPEKAAEAFQKVVALDPDDPIQYNIQGVALSRTGDTTGAVHALEKAIQIDPRYAAAWNNLGVTYFGMDDIGKALEAFDRAIALKPDEPEFYSNKGYALLKKHDYSGALSSAKTARNIDMTCVPAWFVSGEAQFNQGNFKDAFYSFDGGFNAQSNSELWYYQGSKNTQITSDLQAMDAYYSAVASNVRFTGLWDRTTVIQYKIKRYQDTLDLYDQILAITPDYPAGWKNKGFCAIKLSRFESAKDAYERAMESFPNDPDVLSGYGYACGILGDYLKAMNNINKAIELEPASASAYLYKGLTYSYYGQREDAISAYKKGLEYNPHDAELFEALSDVQFKNGDTLGGIINSVRAIIGF